jgi:aryl-alcohol dehydrogenase-like predicted oxidoreductase
MKYTKLGTTGLDVSKLCLGCMTFGIPDRGAHPWTLDEEKSRPIIRKAVELGINFFDTANTYSDGTSEEIVGRALRDMTRRDETVIATKVYNALGPPGAPKAPNRSGLSRKAILQGIDDSLARLGTDYVDLYQIHRWDYETPIEETLEALNDVVRSGKARYIGASSMYAWQFCKALYLSKANGWAAFVSMQDHLNLLNREEEREMLPLCEDRGIAVLPWSPLARGRLTRDADATSERSQSDAFGSTLYAAMVDSDRQVISRVAGVAKSHDVPRARVALAWLLAKPVVTAPIVGASKPYHLDDAVAALSLSLSSADIASLEEAYVPHPVVGFQ